MESSRGRAENLRVSNPTKSMKPLVAPLFPDETFSISLLYLFWLSSGDLSRPKCELLNR